MKLADLPDRLAHRIDVDPSGCWRWTGTTTPKGYGTATIAGVSAYVHRWTYHLLVDSTLALNPGRTGRHQLDHVAERCAVGPSCCNPSHLEPVTNRTNNVRASVNRYGFSGVSLRCSRFHAYTKHEGKDIYLGAAETPAGAAELYDAACVALGDTPANHAAGRLPAPPSATLVDEMRERIERRIAATEVEAVFGVTLETEGAA